MIAEPIRVLTESGALQERREFSQYRPRWRDTLTTTYRDRYRVVVPKCQTCSPNILTQLNVWEHFDVASLGHLSFEGIHVGIETSPAKFAFSDRRTCCGDPDFSAVPYDRLISRDYSLGPSSPLQSRSPTAGSVAEILTSVQCPTIG